MMLSGICLSDVCLCDVCLSDISRVHLVGRLDGAYWLIRPGLAGLAQGCHCALPLQAWAGAYRGGSPLTACCFCNLLIRSWC